MLRKSLLLTAIAGSLFAGNVKMDLNAKYGANNFHTKGAVEFSSLVKDYSKGTVKITVHPGSALIKGNPLKAVKDGTVAMTDMFIPFTSGGGKVFGISALPFIANSYEDAYKLYQLAKPAYEKTAKKWNQKLLYSVTWPASGFYSKKDITSISDFKGVKTRTYDKNSASFINMSGGSAVALPWGEVYSSLRTGMVDSVVTSSSSGKDGKFWEVLDNYTKINYAYPLQAVTINLDYWNSLDKSQKEALTKAASEIEKSQWEAVKVEEKTALEELNKNGIKIKEASPQLKKELDVIANDLLTKYLDGANSQIQGIFKEYRK
ncbi:TRAP transporter substrate-binding protein [Poseidonibacter ostreae]|jgi:TRAP-type transport system periplasmic protein|uniref:ABC transporter substrate-binding protein n=1 Tax=Poseidonibacter ostreae TaxID=2654171 RepID=A0A6L4WR29_9BACT|nr:TRAP transporter substrate-binding protein [Poseidonibacter ostreae]KAB7887249.1 ABC transporter substrate-binding protein [Poseidonibacter ostreae]KAB7888306.1 ABC transporter substrate-binding protein [Poseidonibacter ostreae]KAB7889520.1 ABC transporter substrate-binding protein [Poseidonibacter ostreae]MAC82914.1 ABC transporter substrate-binding protein [Arcobacter sp.]|tara:strand:- start:747 stop:1703 length:957 start_codon:yes stop_codon:yes gene_type:complete